MRLPTRELAAEVGISHRAANIFVARVGLKRDQDGKIDRKAFLAARAQYVNPAQQQRGVKGGRPMKAPARKAGRASPQRGESHSDSLGEAQRQREWLKAKREGLQLEKLEAKLIDVAEVEAAAFERARAERDALLNLPARVAPILAAEFEIDNRKLFLALEKQIRLFLSERAEAGPLLNSNGSKAISDRAHGGG